MTNKYNSAKKKIQDIMTLYQQMDSLPNRTQWHFEPRYKDGNSCAFVFAHTTADVSKRYDDLKVFANVLDNAGIDYSFIARDGKIADVIIKPEHTDLARKMFARYQTGGHNTAKGNEVLLEQEWLRQRQK